jgi:hypothetical protein
VRQELKADNSAVLIVPNAKARGEAQHYIPHLILHDPEAQQYIPHLILQDLLWEIIIFCLLVGEIRNSYSMMSSGM